MKNKIKKIAGKAFLSVLVAMNLLFFPVYSASAISLDFVSGDSIDSVLDDLGVDKTALSKEVQTFNMARLKKYPPQVSLTFTPSDPTDNQQVTATATPTYFLNDAKNLYFTWYLKTKNCDKTDLTGDDKDKYAKEKDECDLNDDGKVDVEDWKIKAMRIYASNDFDWQKADYSDISGDAGYTAIHGGDDQKGKNNFCYVHDTKTGLEFLMQDKDANDGVKPGCNGAYSHLFPSAPGDITGDGVFGSSERKFWHTNPNGTDTAGTGYTDEANVAGLGANAFTWTYSSGDEIGVVAEGISIEPAPSPDASYKIEWAFLNNKCDIPTEGSTIDITDETTNMDVDDLNKCLYDNMVTPNDGTGSAGKLNVSVTASPTSPTNDSSGNGSGDPVSLVASVTDNVDLNYLSYNWEVYSSDTTGDDGWGSQLLKSEIPSATITNGIGVNTFGFNMNFTDPKKYLKVKVTVTETLSSGDTREGHNSVIIPISSTSERIKVYPVKASDDGNLSLGSNEKCIDNADNPNAVCPVLKDEIVGMKIDHASDYSDFSWSVNGDPITYNGCFFDGCKDEKQSDTAFFPILKDSGSQYNVQLIATKSTGEKITLRRIFKIFEPTAGVVSADTSTCQAKYLGYFDNLDGTTTPSYSTDTFNCVAGSTIKLAPQIVGVSMSKDNFAWVVDGTAVDMADDGIITIPGKNSGEYYSVSLIGNYVPDVNILKALNKHWGVGYGDIYQKNLGKSITIQMVDSIPGGQTASLTQKNKKMFATIASGIPAYLAFLIRTILSISLIIFVLRLIFSLSPRLNENDY